MNKTNFLLELFSEEIPAMMHKDAENGYKQIFDKYFTRYEICFDKIEVSVGPRRVSIHASGLPKELPSKTLELKGPKLGSAPTIIESFCKSHGVTAEDLKVATISSSSKQMQYYVLVKTTLPTDVSALLASTLHEAISDYAWPKSMYWGDYKIKWVRPLKNILCIIDDESSSMSAKVVEFEYGHLKSNNLTFGHRLGSNQSLKINSIKDYERQLEENFVILSRQQRLNMILGGLREIAEAEGLFIKYDPVLLEEVIGLADYPKVLLGRIQDRFMQVPSSVLIASMRTHQKYFSCLARVLEKPTTVSNDLPDFTSKSHSVLEITVSTTEYHGSARSDIGNIFRNDGVLAPYFIFVSNLVSDDYAVVVRGNEKVLSARLSDALYFYQQDLKTSLKDKAQKLDKIVFHEKLGSLKDKISRLCKLTLHIDKDNTDAAFAASLSKSDIVSEVVREFPTLQGLMGYIYATAEGQNPIVAEFLRDQYKPFGAGDSVPGNNSYLLALCEKIDSLCGLMLAGIKATGSKDPYSLRRMALGLLRIIIENKVSIDIKDLVYFAVNNYDHTNGELQEINKTCRDVLLFIEERLKYSFKDRFDATLINASFDLQKDGSILNNISKLEALSNFIQGNSGEIVLHTYKRLSNMLGSNIVHGSINDELFSYNEESHLRTMLEKAENDMSKALGCDDYNEAFTILASLSTPIAKFFDNVMINDEDNNLRDNRLCIVAKARDLFQQVTQFDILC